MMGTIIGFIWMVLGIVWIMVQALVFMIIVLACGAGSGFLAQTMADRRGDYGPGSVFFIIGAVSLGFAVGGMIVMVMLR